MHKLLVFSGTSEGRTFNKKVNDAGIETIVFVATEYGEIVMEPHRLCEIRQGRLLPEQMEKVFTEESFDWIVDATHPYAANVTANIRKAAENAGVFDKYIRLSRERKEADDMLSDKFPDIEIVPSAAAAAKRAEAFVKEKGDEFTGSVFLTTGVRELGTFMAEEHLAEHIIARILPSMDSLRIAGETGIKSSKLICMEGPFDAAMNIALFKNYHAMVMVTKNSGARGGFTEKLEAAKALGIHTIIIDPGRIDDGFSENQVLKKVGVSPSDSLPAKVNKVNIVGIGVGKKALLTEAALNAIKKADILIGAGRMLDFGREINLSAKGFKEYAPAAVKAILDENEFTSAAVLMSGDTGFFSGAAGVKDALMAEGAEDGVKKYTVEFLNGISSLAYFASKIMVPYSEAYIMSLHGQGADIKKGVMSADRLFSILTDGTDIGRVCEAVVNLRGNASVYVGRNLGQSDESIICFKADNVPAFEKNGLYIMAVNEYER